jgi:predicted DNA-binding transcriptional regulator YafY
MADRIRERVARIVRLRDMFYENLGGYLATELAERLGVSLRSIERDLALLQEEPLWVPLVCEHRRWRLMVENMSKLPPLRLTQQEATAVFVAGRLLDQVSDEPNPYI